MAKLSHILIPVSDINKSKEFYVDKLGLRVQAEHTHDNQSILLLASTDNDSVILISSQQPINNISHTPSIAVGWLVGNLKQVCHELEARGIIFYGNTMRVGELEFRNLCDPDGNIIQLTQAS